MRCPVCGTGEIAPVAVEGRRWRYRNIPDVPVPDSLAIPTCDRCGEAFINRRLAAELDEALSPVYDSVVSKKVTDSLELLGAAGLRQRDLEPLLGLSAGYLSKVKNGKGTSPLLVSALMLLAVDPRLAERLRRLWSADVDLHAEQEETFSLRWKVTASLGTTEFVRPPGGRTERQTSTVLRVLPRSIAA